MAIIWDEKKKNLLKAQRGISLEEVAEIILDKKYLEILENPSNPDQMVFVLNYHGYIHIVPFIVDEKGNLVLKTVFPSRKFNKKYGKEKNDNKA